MKLIPTLSKTVVATCFASNLTRLESLIMAADAAGRTPVLVGRSLLYNVKVAKEIGYFKNTPKCYDIKEAENIPSDNALYICTGSQANYRSALTSIVNNQSKYVKLGKGDTVIFSSKIIPGNEEKISEMQEKLIAQGVNVITDKDALVHTSGHCSKEEIRHMYELLRPRLVLPVHGDKKFIREHKRFAAECGINEVMSMQNGDVVLLKDGKAFDFHLIQAGNFSPLQPEFCIAELQKFSGRKRRKEKIEEKRQKEFAHIFSLSLSLYRNFCVSFTAVSGHRRPER